MENKRRHPTIPANSAALLRELPADTSAYPAGCNLHIFPDGEFQTSDGRPARITEGKLTHWRMDQAIADALIAVATRPILVDIDHASMYGDTAASGWIEALHYEPGRGLFGRCAWTADGAEAVAGRVYRYLSPYFDFSPTTGAPVLLRSVAITNDPALDDLGAVALSRQLEDAMPDPQTAALTAERDALNKQVAALTTERDGLQTQVAALQKQIDDAAAAAETKEKAALIEAACSGDKPKLTPAMAKFAATLDLAACKTLIETAPTIDLAAQRTDAEGGDGLSDAERAMCSRMGVTPEAFLATRNGQVTK